MQVYTRKGMKAIKSFMYYNYGTPDYKEFYDSVVCFHRLGLITEEAYRVIIEFDMHLTYTRGY